MKYFFKENGFAVALVIALSIKFFWLYKIYDPAHFEVMYKSNNDPTHYLKIGENIATHYTFSDNDSKTPTESAAWRPPIWPLVLAIPMFFSTNLLYAIIFKCVIDSLLLLLILYIIRKKTRFKIIQALPFLLLFIEPQYLKYATTFWSEGLTAVLILLLAVVFLFVGQSKKFALAMPILSAVIILCHPVSVFYVLALFGIFLILQLRNGFVSTFSYGLLFAILMMAWPIRNQFTFSKGFFMTASQGAALSKAWNEKTAVEFTNVAGDLADENLNLQYLDEAQMQHANNPETSIIDKSKLFKEGTINFISNLTFKEKILIVSRKLTANFNPFPEKPKAGMIEHLSIPFRILYLFLFFQLGLRLFQGRFDFSNVADRVWLVTASVLMGQIIMATLLYTGFRFNSIYGPVLLFCFLFANTTCVTRMVDRLLPAKTHN